MVCVGIFALLVHLLAEYRVAQTKRVLQQIVRVEDLEWKLFRVLDPASLCLP